MFFLLHLCRTSQSKTKTMEKCDKKKDGCCCWTKLRCPITGIPIVCILGALIIAGAGFAGGVAYANKK